MNRAAADERRSGNEESRGAVMSGAERVEPEVSPTPAEKPRNNNTHKDAGAHTHMQTHIHIVLLVNCSIHSLEFE